MSGTKPTPDRLRFYCYQPQRVWVMEVLTRMGVPVGMTTVVGVDEHEGLNAIAGMRFGVFVHITNHINPPPPRLWYELKIRGFEVISFDDSRLRDHHRNVSYHAG